MKIVMKRMMNPCSKMMENYDNIMNYILKPEGYDERQAKAADITANKINSILEDYLSSRRNGILDNEEQFWLAFEKIINDICSDLMTTEDLVYMAKHALLKNTSETFKKVM